MLFFGKKNSAPGAPKGRSIMGTLFNPDFGTDIRPLAETTSVFVNLIAMIFAMNGLFPREHPALTGASGAPRLTLAEIFITAWRSLSFTRTGIPRILLFFAVIGIIVFSILAIITFLMTLILGTAHAQGVAASAYGSSSTGPFEPLDASKDLAQNWIDYIFKALPISNYYSVRSGELIPQSTTIQCGLMTALAFYSNAILIIAAFILFYHLTAMVVETAHHGVVMGRRANQIWAPIRLVVAVGLLVPIGSMPTACSGGSGGLNSGQYIVIQMAEWGSGLASKVWSIFLDKLASEKYQYVRPQIPYVNNLVADIVEMEACAYAYNTYVSQIPPGMVDVNDFRITRVRQGGPTVQTLHGHSITISSPVEYVYRNRLLSDANICGKIKEQVVSAPSPDLVDPSSIEARIPTLIEKAHIDTIDQLINGGNFTKVGEDVRYFIPTLYNGDPPDSSDLDDLVNKYQTQLQSHITTAMGTLYDNSLTTIAGTWSAEGWASAGAWFNTIARTQGAIVDATKDGLPTTTPPQIGQIAQADSFPRRAAQWLFGQRDNAREANTIYTSVMNDLKNFRTWLENGDVLKIPPPTTSSDCAAASGVIGRQLDDAMAGASGRESEGIMSWLLSGVDHIAGINGLWQTESSCTTPGGNKFFTLGFQFDKTANPLAEVAYLGHVNLQTAYGMIGWMVGSEFAAGVSNIIGSKAGFIGGLLGAASGAVFGLIAAIIGIIALIFFTGGLALAFVVPLMPFFRFFFNILTWALSLLEAVVAVPLIALAHLNPEGDGLPGPSARNAYFLILNVFLRPVLMIFGLVCGLLVFFVAITFLNKMYALAAAGSGGLSHGYATIGRLIYSIIYVVLVYVCANNSFKTIGAFPEHALRWIGSQAHHERMGDPKSMQDAIAIASGYLGKQVFDNVTAAVSKPSGAIQRHISDNQATKAAADKHEQTLRAQGYTGRDPDGRQLPGGRIRPHNPDEE